MKQASFTESVRFTADSLLPAGVVSTESRVLMQEYATTKFESDEAKAEFRSKIQDSLAPVAVKALASVGASLPFDAIQVHLEFGSFLYDLYDLGSVKPLAPLAAAAHQRRLQNLAARLEKGDVTLKPEELAVIKRVLESDELWKAAKFNCYVEAKGESGETEKRALTLTVQGIQFYNKTLNAVVKLFEAPNETAADKPASETAQESEVQVS